MAAKPTYATGRRKTSSARVYLTPADGPATMTVNGRALDEYFPRATARMVIHQPLQLTERADTYSFRISVAGGGLSGQAGAVLHGISRALQTVEPELRDILKKAGFLTRDSRAVERKKPGRHKARKKPQFSKR